VKPGGGDVQIAFQHADSAFHVSMLHIVRMPDGKLLALNGQQQSFGEVEPDPTNPGQFRFKGTPTEPRPNTPPVTVPGGTVVVAPPPAGTTPTTPPAGAGTQTATTTPTAPPLVTGTVKNSDGSRAQMLVEVGGTFKMMKVMRLPDGKTVAVSGNGMSYGEVRQGANGQWEFTSGAPTPPAANAQPLNVPEGQPVQQAGGGAATGQGQGGGILNSGPAPTIQNSTIQGNQAQPQGGGILNSGPAPTIQNSTISGNREVSFSGFSGSSSELPNIFAPGTQTRWGDYSVGAGSQPAAANVFLINPSTGRPMASSTGRDICNPCTFLPNATGGAPVVDMPLLIQSAGGQPAASPGFTAIVAPANGGGIAVSDQMQAHPLTRAQMTAFVVRAFFQ
jgi:hypothetical protein